MLVNVPITFDVMPVLRTLDQFDLFVVAVNALK